MANISLNNVSLKFRIYHDKSPSIKDYFARGFQFNSKNRYSDFWALKDITLNIRSGERIGIIGHNGAGKSTLLKTICKIYEPAAGHIHVEGNIAPLLEIGAGFHPEFTGRENLYLNGSILGYTRKQLEKIEEEIIEFAELDEFIDTPVKNYSSGMYMRLAFSIATAIHPDILILDEVFAGGDAGFIQKAKARMQSFIDKANIMLAVSHDLSQLSSMCNRIIWLDHGRIKMDGPADEVISCYEDNLPRR